jgi:DNA polymerase-3 subunit alpha
MSEFTHLHVHTQYSVLDGAAKIAPLISKAKELNMKALAITDHGNMFGALEFYFEALKQNIKPIIGCEMYVAEGSRFDKKGRADRSGFHLILLAKNMTGYQNLIKLCSLAFKKEHFYYTPRIDKELLRQYSEGLIASSACLGGEIPYYILNSGYEQAAKVVEEYLEIFGEDFYLEFQNHHLEEQAKVNKVLLQLADEYNIKCIATNDVHFINAEDAEPHHVLICLNTNRDYNDSSGMHYSGHEYLKSAEEMHGLFPDHPELITNTQEIVDKIEEYKLKRDVILPVFPLPEGFNDEMEYLTHLTYKGAERKYGEITAEVKERIDYELDVIRSMGFPGYFLIVQDFINEAKKMDVMVGPGRGSAAGSVVAYCTGITNIDPIKYNLLFERFLNPERVTMPDIDVDFDDEGREKVLKYVVEKYGENRVAQIVTFGTMAAKSSIKDVGRVLNVPLSDTDRLSKLVPETPGITLEKAFEEVAELNEEYKKGNDKIKQTIDFARKLEGTTRHTGTHACGVIIGPDDLSNYIPLSTSKDSDLMVSQFEGTLIESVGMLKMDFLGLKTLSIIKTALDNIYKRHHIKIDIESIPLDDQLTFDLFQKGDTVGIFQFESEGMRMYLKELKPNTIEDLIAMNALYRPGPMQYIPVYINRKHGREKVEYPDPLLEEVLKPTYGIMVYQEQIMQTAQILGGYSLGRADLLRRAMGKKKIDLMQSEKSEFVKGAVAKGINENKAKEIFDIMLKFAEYGFNRSHSAAYSVIAYYTAYLKAHYTAEYMAALLTHNINDIKKITFFIDECNHHKIPVLGPCVNESDLNFTVNKKGEIRFGLAAIKGVGETAARSIIDERAKNDIYSDIFDFARRVNLRSVNKKSFEALALSGAFDTFDDMHRAQFFHQERNEEINFIEKIIKHTTILNSNINSMQQSLFGEEEVVAVQNPPLPDIEPWSKLEQLKKEKEVVGFYLSGHPLDDFKLEIDNFCNIDIEKLNSTPPSELNGREIRIAGILSSVNHRTTKKGDPMASFNLEDYTGSLNLALYSEDYLKYKHVLIDGQMVFVKALARIRLNTNNQIDYKVQQVILLSEVIEKLAKRVRLIIPLELISDEFTETLNDILKKCKGNTPIKISVSDIAEKLTVDFSAGNRMVDAVEVINRVSIFDGIKIKF